MSDPPPPADEQPEMADLLRSPQPSTARLDVGGVPIFPNTPEGWAERLAYYEARKLNYLPDSLLDYHDVVHGRETPAERPGFLGRTRVLREPSGTRYDDERSTALALIYLRGLDAAWPGVKCAESGCVFVA